MSEGTSAYSRIAGWYYNDSRGPGSGVPYNGNEGDIWVSNGIRLNEDNQLVAHCYIQRCNIADPWGGDWTDLLNEDFTASIGFDTEYTLSIEYTGSKFLLKCNDETYQYDVTSARHPPFKPQRELRSRVYAGPGEPGFLSADFDDVYAITDGTPIRVPDDVATIQGAIDIAEDGDTILVAPGTYVENIDFLGRPVTVRSEAGPDSTTISSSGGGVVQFENGETQATLLKGFTLDYGIDIFNSSPRIENCILFGGVAHGGGAGTIYENASPTLSNCIISGGNAQVGGAFDIIDSSASFVNCIFFGNSASADGGGLYTDNSSVTVTNCTFWGEHGDRIWRWNLLRELFFTKRYQHHSVE